MQDHDGSLMFFDFLGAFVIRWPHFISTIINITSIFIGAYSIYLNMKVARQGKWLKIYQKKFFFWFFKSSDKNFNILELKTSTYLKQILICVSIICASWIISMMSVTFIALILTKLEKVMSWYARPAWLFFLYVCPTLAVSMLCFLYAANRQKQVNFCLLLLL